MSENNFDKDKLEMALNIIRRDNEYRLVEAQVHDILVDAYKIFCKKEGLKKVHCNPLKSSKPFTFEEFLKMSLRDLKSV